ncbi:MAG: S8 family serine peptidase, partial [Clostridia bacterium]|nr:S8 family serine peptidase [Clostridia bacterium]
MAKIQKTALRLLIGILVASLFSGAVFSVGKKGTPVSAGEKISESASEPLISDVSGLINTYTERYYDPSVIYKLPDTVSSDDEISVIVSMTAVPSVIERYNAADRDIGITEYAASAEAAETVKKADAERQRLLKALDKSGVGYSVGEIYDTILSGFEITVKAEDFALVGDALGENAQLIVGEVYEPAATTEIITNDVDVYPTGIFNSANSRYQGDGIVVAILDTGLDYTHTAFSISNFSTDREKFTLDSAGNKIVVNPSNDPTDVYSVNVSDTAAARFSAGLTAQDVYMNKKVPYAYDYADKDPDVLPINSEHGTHVAGIIAGKDEVITGVAPNAQLAIMKVFSDTMSGAKTSWLMAALEDCVVLGVDVINMSLGSACGFSRESDEEETNRIYDSIKAAGISLITAAGNNDNATTASKKNGTNPLTSNPDSGTVGSPSTYSAALSVASVNGVSTPYIKFGDQIIYFNEAATNSGKYKNFIDDILKNAGTDSKEFEYVTIPGLGRSSDYPNDADFYRGKIVLIKRGITTFEEKVRIALIEKCAAGAIIYNNISGQISMQVGADIGAVCSISQDDGELLAAQETGKILISRANTAGPFMSDFSSWGPTSDLKIKPEITGHGGEIYSSIPGQSYDRLSGTSMACPNVAGATALIRQYVTYSGVFGDPTPQEITAYVNQLMMSTADIIKNKNGLPASVRKQGAGLVSITKSVTTSAYVTTFDANGNVMDKTKLEYGDDKTQSGVYTLTFDINNVTDKSVSYDVNSIITTEGISTTYTGHDEKTSTQEGYLLGGTNTEVLSVTGGGSLSGKTVSVSAHGSAKVTVRLTLSENDKKYLKDNFSNGMYVEGFITMTAKSGATVNLNVPLLVFFGDWNKAPIFDEEFYDTDKDDLNKGLDEVDKLMPDAYATRIIGGTYSDYIVALGQYVFIQNPASTQIAADRNKIAISNFEDGKASAVTKIRSIYAGLLRNVEEWDLIVTDDATGEVIFFKSDVNQRKSYSSSSVYPSS